MIGWFPQSERFTILSRWLITIRTQQPAQLGGGAERLHCFTSGSSLGSHPERHNRKHNVDVQGTGLVPWDKTIVKNIEEPMLVERTPMKVVL